MTARSISRSVASPLSRGIVGRLAQFIWTPTALFAEGQQGVWYEPTPEYLYQDAAGTLPVTADGDPVGNSDDRSPNDNDATQVNSMGRPVYRTDGTLHWLAGDGVDDYLSVGNIPAFNGVSELSYSFAVSNPTNTNQHAIFAKWNTSNNFGFVLDFFGGNARAFFGNSTPHTSPVTLDGSVHVYSVSVSGGLMSMWIDGVKTIDNAAVSSSISVNNTEPLTVLAKTDAGTVSAFADVDLFGLVARPVAYSDDERVSVEGYLANLAGITL